MKLEMRRKLPLTFVALSTLATAALAQDGTFSVSNLIFNGTGVVREYIYDIDGSTLLPKAAGAVQFVYDGTVLGLGTYGFVTDGIFANGAIGIPGKAGQTVTIAIDVWDKSTATTYTAALTSGHFLPEQKVTINLGGVGGVPSSPAQLGGFAGGKLITAPEPSILALTALGLGSLIFIFRPTSARSVTLTERL
jgi:hypothetical protein